MTEVALFGAGRIGKIHAGNVARQPGVTPFVIDSLAGYPIHAGLILESGFMLHCMEGRGTVRESYLANS